MITENDCKRKRTKMNNGLGLSVLIAVSTTLLTATVVFGQDDPTLVQTQSGSIWRRSPAGDDHRRVGGLTTFLRPGLSGR